MNISEAKEYIKNSVRVYLKKDEYGDYRIPIMRQRPIFLLGAPGIGKTAIMEQIASELGIALVSYSMTHHTRQSALGLPYIEEKEYGGEKVSVSEYTMSEIIAAVYETMEKSGIKEGILFLDEINCVSETLAPSMLQFLQYKVFGRHQVPEGWVIVTAGNPPEYNKSVREFDVVTMDRLKVLNIEADYPAWKQYAKEKALHTAVLNFLDLKKEYFYHIETTSSGRSYVTARGWEDLSDIIVLYEEEGLVVNENLIGQYLQNEKIVREFAAYYDLYNKYKQDYRIEALLKGDINDSMIEKASNASLDERLSLTGILLDKIQNEIKDIMIHSDAYKEMLPALRNITFLEEEDAIAGLLSQINARKSIINIKSKAGALTIDEKRKHNMILKIYRELYDAISVVDGNGESVARHFNDKVSALKEKTTVVKTHIHNMFDFISKAFGDESNEMLVLVTELTVSSYGARFISTFGSDDYAKYNDILMVTDRKQELHDEVAKLVL